LPGLVELSGNKAVKMENFENLAEAISEADPELTDESSYTSANKPAPCPATTKTWQASPNLPPTPDNGTCACMFATLTCVPAPGLDEKKYGDIFKFVCGSAGAPCSGIRADADLGVYGAYSMCSPEHKLGYVLDRYYKNQKSASSACDFSGQATIVTPTKVNDGCSEKLASASAVNSLAATATGSSDKKKNDGAGLEPMVFSGLAVMVAAAVAGAGMVVF
jgi:1,3-beta-glucanosyltransferase GAS1